MGAQAIEEVNPETTESEKHIIEPEVEVKKEPEEEIIPPAQVVEEVKPEIEPEKDIIEPEVEVKKEPPAQPEKLEVEASKQEEISVKDEISIVEMTNSEPEIEIVEEKVVTEVAVKSVEEEQPAKNLNSVNAEKVGKIDIVEELSATEKEV